MDHVFPIRDGNIGIGFFDRAKNVGHVVFSSVSVVAKKLWSFLPSLWPNKKKKGQKRKDQGETGGEKKKGNISDRDQNSIHHWQKDTIAFRVALLFAYHTLNGGSMQPDHKNYFVNKFLTYSARETGQERWSVFAVAYAAIASRAKQNDNRVTSLVEQLSAVNIATAAAAKQPDTSDAQLPPTPVVKSCVKFCVIEMPEKKPLSIVASRICRADAVRLILENELVPRPPLDQIIRSVNLNFLFR